MRFKIIMNVLLHYKKYKKLLGLQVVIKSNKGLRKYDKYIGKIGVVDKFEFYNFKFPIIVWFPKTDEHYCFSLKEIERRR